MNLIAEHYDWWRAGHIIFVIFWMAALLFLPRQFVYQFQTKLGSKAAKALIEQQGRLVRIIMNPAGLMTWVFGLLLLTSVTARAGTMDVFMQPAWILKLILVLVMTGIHEFYLRQQRKFAVDTRPHSERFWRMMNEVPAVLAIVIVITAVVFL
ncbi:MAG: TIGR00701 family protein [Robiginitomaculum sp.]|nr:MAG: TIGR00701 family protein [Robiginitomaculum sp.]